MPASLFDSLAADGIRDKANDRHPLNKTLPPLRRIVCRFIQTAPADHEHSTAVNRRDDRRLGQTAAMENSLPRMQPALMP